MAAIHERWDAIKRCLYHYKEIGYIESYAITENIGKGADGKPLGKLNLIYKLAPGVGKLSFCGITLTEK
jgi:hypothetical protein